MKLCIGQFYGAPLQTRKVPGFVLSEVCYGPRMVLPKHSHEQAYFSFVWRGGYQEECGRRLRECEAGTAVFHPAGEVHADRFSGAGGHLLNLEINPSPRVKVKDFAFPLAATSYFCGGPVMELGLKLCTAMRAQDPAGPHVIQDLAFEILAEAYESDDRLRKIPPKWLDTVTEILHDRFDEPISLGVVSGCVGLHPVHVARAFRKHYRCSVHEYLRRLRIGFSCRQIARGNMRLVDIALMAGFCDQSHFSKTFKRSTGMSPAEFRTRFRS